MKKRLCMISMDAISAVDVPRLFAMPHLNALQREGVFCSGVNTVYPTITYPIHASLLTGCYPEKHGIFHNKPFQPDTPPSHRSWFWEIGQIKAKTLHQAAWEKGLDVASLLWPVTGKNPYTRRNYPEVLPLPGESPMLKMMSYGTPLWVLWTELRHGKNRVSAHQPHLDRYVAYLCEQLYASRRPPDVLTVHLAVDAKAGYCFIDETEETFGEHGFGLHQPQAKTLFLLSGPGVKPGTLDRMDLVQIAPTLAKWMGLSLPDAQGKPLDGIWTD